MKKIALFLMAPLMGLFSISAMALDVTGAVADLDAAGTSMGTIVAAIFTLAVILVAFGWVKAALFK